MTTRLKNIAGDLWRLIWPDKCLGCDTAEALPEGVLCGACLGDVKTPPRNRCGVCAKPLDFDYEIDGGDIYRCGECLLNPPPYEKLNYALHYAGVSRKLLHLLKFESRPHLAKHVAELGAETLIPWMLEWPDAVIVPVPLSRSKLYKRGYNHAYLLATFYGRGTGLEVAEGILRRTRHTAPQFGLSPKDRLANVKKAFSIHHGEVLRNKKIILLDDIYTTGATVNECCKTLRGAAPAEIRVATLFLAGPEVM